MPEEQIDKLIYKVIGLIINFKHPSLQWRKVVLNP